jgi:hypothetical protein
VSESDHSNWKLLLRYGRLETPYSHFTVLADGRVMEASDQPRAEPGPAWFSMRAWARTSDDAAALLEERAPTFGFEIRGRIEVYATEPERPPGDEPLAYDPNFTTYAE